MQRRVMRILAVSGLLIAATGQVSHIHRQAHAAPAAPLCTWSSASAAFALQLINPYTMPTPVPLAHPVPGVRYAPQPSQAARVLVDQSTGTVVALSDQGALLEEVSFPLNTGLLTVLSDTTLRPPAWFPTTTPSPATPFLVGTVLPLWDAQNHLRLSCGGALFRFSPSGTPQPARITVPSDPSSVDQATDRLYYLDGTAVQGVPEFTLRAIDLHRGTSVLQHPLQGVFGSGTVVVEQVAVDGPGKHLFMLTDRTIPGVGEDPSTYQDALAMLTLQGQLLYQKPLEENGSGRPYLVLAPSIRRGLVLSCETPPGEAITQEYAQVFNLDTGRFLTAHRLPLGQCAGAQSVSIIGLTAPGAFVVDDTAQTAVIIGESWIPPDTTDSGAVEPQPGLAWFIDLKHGTLRRNSTINGCMLVGRRPTAIALDAPQQRAYVASAADGLVTVLDTHNMAVLGTVQVGGQPTGIAVDQHSRQVVVAIDGAPGKTGTPGGVAFFPTSMPLRTVPPTTDCGGTGKSSINP